MVTDFLDSNILVYLFDRTDDRKRRIAERLVSQAQERTAISFQVVQETLNVLTSRLRPPMTRADAQGVLDDVLVPIWRVHPSAGLYARGMELREKHGFSFYDSLIVAAALEAGCKRLLTEDLQHGQRIGALRIENPFQG